MPLYEFYCKKCNKIIYNIVPLAEADKKVKCHHCGEPLKKQITPVMFRVR